MTTQATWWSHVALNCVNQARTEEFYTTWFGFSRAREIALPDTKIVFLRREDILLELFEVGPDGAIRADGDGPHQPGAVRHIAFQTDDVDALLAQMGDAADVTLGPLGFDDFIPGWRTAWLRDPDGVVVEISQGYHDQERRDQEAEDQHDQPPTGAMAAADPLDDRETP